MPLRVYQRNALAKLERSPHKSVLLVAPTGAGKGTMAAALIYRYVQKRKRILFLVHRRELVHDMERRLAARGIKTAQTKNSTRPVRVLSVQTATRMGTIPSADLLIVDEAHHYAADTWRRVLETIEVSRIVGFTATPQRSDGRPLGDMFQEIIDVISYSALLEKKYIVPCRVLRPREILSNELAQDPAEAYLRYGQQARALIFVRRIDDARSTRDVLQKHGVRAEMITSYTKKPIRDDIMQRLENGELDVVANVGTLTEGIDVPHISCIILAKVCAHASSYVQIVGRALRAASGKEEATLIDLIGASHLHGLPGQDRHYSLEGNGIEVQKSPRYDEPERTEVPAYSVRDMALEVVEPYRAQALPKVLPLPKIPKPRKPYVKKGRPEPKPVTDGFVFASKEFWNLGWYEHGVQLRTGLATKDRAEAEELLALFRAEGVEALKQEVRQRKRKGVTIWSHYTDNWRLRTWSEDRTKTVEYRLFTESEEEAQAIRALFIAGRRTEALARIAHNAKSWEKILQKRKLEQNKKTAETMRKRHAERRAQASSPLNLA